MTSCFRPFLTTQFRMKYPSKACNELYLFGIWLFYISFPDKKSLYVMTHAKIMRNNIEAFMFFIEDEAALIFTFVLAQLHSSVGGKSLLSGSGLYNLRKSCKLLHRSASNSKTRIDIRRVRSLPSLGRVSCQNQRRSRNRSL